MGAFNLTATMDGLGTAITTWAGVPNVYAYPVENVTVPCALVDYPSLIDLTITFDRGGDHVIIPVFILVGQTATKDARDALSVLLAGGADLVAALEGATGFGEVNVGPTEIAQVTVGAITYLGLKLDVEVWT